MRKNALFFLPAVVTLSCLADTEEVGNAQAPNELRSLPAPCFEDDNTNWTSCCATGSALEEGGSSADSITGDSGADCIVGYERGDTLAGAGGDDRLFGGAGPDDIAGGTGDDLGVGGGGNDRIVFAGSSSDSSEGYGGAGDDVLESGDDISTLYGQEGDDYLIGGDGADTLEGGEGMDAVDAGPGNDTIVISSICDLQAGEFIDGGTGSDTLESPFTSTQLADMGITVTNVETFTVLMTGASDQCDGFSAPTGWSTTGGLSYRRATSQELVRNNWVPGTYIVERSSTGGLYYGQSSATVLVPRADNDTETITLTREVTAESGSFGSISYKSGVSHSSETIYFDTFEKHDVTGGYYGRVVIADDDSLHGQVVNSHGEMFQVMQLQSNAYIDTSLSSPPMSAADSVVVSPQGDVPPGPSNDNPGTGTIVKMFYMGGGSFCMLHEDDWQVFFMFQSQTVRAVHFNSDTGADMSLVYSTCHFFGSRDEANTCAETEVGAMNVPSYCYDGDSHVYPFIETRSLSGLSYSTWLLDAAWDSLDHAALHLTIPDVDLIQVIPGGNIYSPSRFHLIDGDGDGPNLNPSIDEFATFKGRSISTGNSSGLPSAHGFGYNFVGAGATAHGNAEAAGGQYSYTIMWEEVFLNTAPWFSSTNAGIAENCVDESYCPVGGAWTSP